MCTISYQFVLCSKGFLCLCQQKNKITTGACTPSTAWCVGSAGLRAWMISVNIRVVPIGVDPLASFDTISQSIREIVARHTCHSFDPPPAICLARWWAGSGQPLFPGGEAGGPRT